VSLLRCLLWKSRSPLRPGVGVQFVELRIQAHQAFVDDTPDRPQRMPRRHPRLDVDVREQIS
jgi:hypothetical protein